ncbi:MAG: hypothetical protein RJA00_472 [Bacteroidota bacterium]
MERVNGRILFVDGLPSDRHWRKFPKIFLGWHSLSVAMESLFFLVNFEEMITKVETYVEKMNIFVRMKKKLTLLVDADLVERMKRRVSADGQSLSAMVEQFFAQQLSNQKIAPPSPSDSDADEFIIKFGGLISRYAALSDAQIKEMVYQERLKKHL